MRMVRRDGSVTIEAAAALAHVDVITIRRWGADGALRIERQGDMESVRLADVDALAGSGATGARRDRVTLRGLLRGATKVDALDVSELQQLVRERSI